MRFFANSLRVAKGLRLIDHLEVWLGNTGLRNTFCRSSSAYNMLKFPNCLVTPPHPKLSLIAKKV